MATPKQFRRRTRWGLIVGMILAILAFGAVMASADTPSPDGDTVKSGNNITYQDPASPGQEACSARGTAIAGQITVTYNGSNHFTAGEAVDVTLTSPNSGITVDYTATNVASAWDTNGQTFNIPISTTTATSVAQGTYTVLVDLAGHTSGYTPNQKSYTVTVGTTCTVTTANHAPVVEAGGPYGPTAEGSPTSLSGATATDADNDTLTYLWSAAPDSGYNDVDAGALCSFTPNNTSLKPSVTCTDDGHWTLTLAVDDGHVATPVTDTASLTVTNANPVISSASFGATNPTCGADNASLTVSFTDAGSNDTHKADIDWNNDSTYDQTVNPYTSGTAITHTYSAGLHTAAVKITDDDGGYATATANVVVNYVVSGVLQPVNDTRNGQQPSVFKYKSTIPVKIQIQDCDGSYPSTLAPTITVGKLSGSPPAVGEDEAASTVPPTSGNTLRFTGAPDNQYIYNLATKNLSDSSATYKLTITIQPGQTIDATFGLKP